MCVVDIYKCTSEGTEQSFKVVFIEPIEHDGRIYATGSLTESEVLDLGLSLGYDGVIRVRAFWNDIDPALRKKFNATLV